MHRYTDQHLAQELTDMQQEKVEIRPTTFESLYSLTHSLKNKDFRRDLDL